MENIVVGGADCSIRDVWAILSKSYMLKEKWSDLAGYLRIPLEEIKTLQQNLLLNTINRNGVLMQILHIWQSGLGSDAKLAELIRVIEDECRDYAVGEKLRLFFNLPCIGFQKETENWFSLSTAFQKKVVQNISNLFPTIPTSKVKSKLEGDVLFDLMTGKRPKLFNSTVPPNPKFYLGRTLLPRHTISEKVFEEDAPDILLFTGLNKFELGRLVKMYETSTSGGQLNSTKIHARFILLEQSGHFQEICKRVTVPVHLLSYDSRCGNPKWMKTSGRINHLQRFVDKCQNPLTEDELLKVFKNGQHSTILIADSPGMGKSFLLANIANKLEKGCEQIVAFTSVHDFIKQVKYYSGLGKTKIDSAKITLHNLISNNALGKLQLSRILSSSNLKIELFMDGFDEVGGSDAELALQTTKLIKSAFKSIRLWISTRPHHLEELEAELEILGYNIKGFDENDQINFLKSHWQHSNSAQNNDLNQDKLTEYARNVLQKIKRQLNKDDNDIAGIPLQCFLIGEVFEEECTNFASEENVIKSYPSNIKINSISDLYKNMITNKFQKYIRIHVSSEFAGIDDFIQAHIELSIKLLFPQYNPKLDFIRVDINNLLNIGIIQRCGSDGNTEFIHRTFAEYFVARYVIDKLFRAKKSDRKFVAFLLNEILMRKEYYVKLLPYLDGITSYKFTHDVISYFVNANISYFDTISVETGMYTETIEPETKVQIYHACANSSFLQIFKLFLKNEYSSLDETTVLLAIRNSTCEYSKFIVSCILEDFESFNEQHLSNFLRVAVQRSEPEILDFLLKNIVCNFRKLIENLNDSTKLLLHDCISNTKYKLRDDIEKRLGIVQQLCEINPDILEQKDEFGRTAIFGEYVHVDLLIELIRLGADISSRDMKGDTVLHLSLSQSRRLSAEEYHVLIISIPKLKLVDSLNVAFSLRALGAANNSNSNPMTWVEYKSSVVVNSEPPLLRLLYFIDPTKETLDLLAQENPKLVRDAFEVAIEFGRNFQTLENLIKLGVDFSWKSRYGESYLHIASQYGNLDALQLLIQKYNINVNVKDYTGQTPLDHVITSNKTTARFETAKILCKFGGKASKKIRSQGQHLLDQARKDGNAESVRTIQEFLEIGNGNFVEQEISRVSKSQTIYLSDERFKLLVTDFVQTNSVEYKDLKGRSLLQLAVLRSDELAAKELVENGADLSNRDHDGNTPLHSACVCTDLSIGLRMIKFLIDNGANAYAKNEKGYTFVHRLFFRESDPINSSQLHEIVEYLDKKNLLNFLFHSSNEPIGHTLLHLACYLLDVEEKTIILLKEKGISLNQLDSQGKNALTYAIKGDRSKSFINLLINKCDVNLIQQDIHGNTLLHYAAQYQNVYALKLLIESGVNVNQVNKFGESPLHRVAQFGEGINSLKVANVLVNKGVNVGKYDNRRQRALDLIRLRRHNSIFENNIKPVFVKIVTGQYLTSLPSSRISFAFDPLRNFQYSLRQIEKRIFDKVFADTKNINDCLSDIKAIIPTKSDVYAKNQDGYTFLHLEILNKKPSPSYFHEISKYLLRIAGCKKLFETPGGTWGVTVLQLSVLYCNPTLKTLQKLKSNGINFSGLDAEGDSLLTYAIRGKLSSKHFSFLINECGVNWKHLNNFHQNLLHIAAVDGNEEALKFFLEMGIDINAGDLDGNMPIHHVIRCGQDNIQKMLHILISSGADVNAKNNDGETPLHEAATRGDSESAVEVIKYLVENGANPNSIDLSGNTPLYFAINHSAKCLPIVNCLIDNGAKVDPLNFHNTSFLHLTAEVEEMKVLKLFLDMNILDVNAIDGDGDTPLHCALQQKESDYVLEKVKLLLECGADPNIRNKKNQKALDIANDRAEWKDELKCKLRDLLTMS